MKKSFAVAQLCPIPGHGNGVSGRGNGVLEGWSIGVVEWWSAGAARAGRLISPRTPLLFHVCCHSSVFNCWAGTIKRQTGEMIVSPLYIGASRGPVSVTNPEKSLEKSIFHFHGRVRNTNRR